MLSSVGLGYIKVSYTRSLRSHTLVVVPKPTLLNTPYTGGHLLARARALGAPSA